MNSDHKEFLAVLGHCFLQHGRCAEAVTVYEGLAALFPDDVQIKISLGYSALQAQNFNRVLDVTETLLSGTLSARDRGMTLLIQARALWALARTDEAGLAVKKLRAIADKP